MFGEPKRFVRTLMVVMIAISVAAPAAIYHVAGESDGEEYYLVKFNPLPTDILKERISADFAAQFIEYRQENTYLVRLPNARVAALSSIPTVTSITVNPSEGKISPELKGATGALALRINIHRGESVDEVAEKLVSLGATVTRKNSETVSYIECTADAKIIPEISSFKAVSAIHPDGEKQTHMNLIQSNTYMGIDYVQTAAIPFRGSGMLAEVQDNGCDRTHPDLTQVDYTDGAAVSDDHGTCTTGIVFATGLQSANAQGIAYQATGAFADWGTGRTTSVTNLWNGDFNEGTVGLNGVMQSNSWSQGTLDGTYTTYSNEDDAAAVAFPKVLTLWAAGNSNSGTGVGLITQDSANKNGMCIGAIFHQDTAAMGDDDYHDAGMGMTPSRGPAADGRMKPDMCAAFDWIYTVDMVGTAGYTTTNYYDDFGGTSGATPTVAGCTLQAYEMFQENFFDNNPTNQIPYSATIKALMIADAYQYPIGTNLITRNVEGWGTPDMENMYTLGANYHVIEEHPLAISSGTVWTKNVYSDGTKPLKITTAWTDPAAPSTTGTGRTLINNLDLKVTSPTGTVYWGNMGLWNSIWSVSGTGTNDWTRTNPTYTDDENNVENVFIQSPAAGIWAIEVQGAVGDVAQGPQHFSFVASGAMPISGVGSIAMDKAQYRLPDTIEVTVQDLDLNINPAAINTVSINIASTSEPAGETLLLTETGVDTSTFVNTISLSSTNSAGVLWGVHGNTITATYNDADAGGAGPATVTDTATVDAQVLSPSGLTVEWFGLTDITWINEAFAAGVPPTGWSVANSGTTGAWSSQATANAGGTAPEARFMYGNSGTGTSRLISGPFDTTGLTALSLQFRQYYDAYGTGVTVKVQTSTDGAAWTDTGWSIVGGTVNVGPGLVTEAISAAEGAGSSTFYVAWVVDGNSYQLDYWYIDNVLMTSTGGSVTANNWLNWTLSGDDGAGANDIVQYNVYRANNAAGPWDASAIVQTIAPGTATWTDVAKGEPDGINWWYVVRAVDDAGNIDTNTNAVPELPTGNLAPNAPFNPSPANLAVDVSLNPTLSVSVTDPNGDAMDVTFYNAAGPTLIGTDNNVASGGTASIAWNGRTSDTTYTWYAVANDGELTTQSPTWSFTTLDTTAPAAPTALSVDWWGSVSGTATYTYTGVTQASTNHTAWFCDVDD
ncbi:MAG: S8 family serine peptidase, partial [Thermoplasmata archaeon]|nr:S8 family serine peptidase [Thermoplasmata archaeon]